jgi:hypothetical protein
MVSYINGGVQAKGILNQDSRPIFGHKIGENGSGESFIARKFIVFTVHLI